jgi:hypothetical protein
MRKTFRNTLAPAIAGLSALVAAPMVMAQQTLGAAAAAEVATLKADVNTILIALVVVIFAICAYGIFKRASSK